MNAKTETQPLDPIAEAVADVRRLLAERQKAYEAAAALEQQTRATDDVQRRLNELDAAERNAMTAWAASGAAGNPPSPDRAKRQKLTAELTEAMATANAARSALSAVQAKAVEIQERINGAQQTLFALKLQALSLRADEFGAKYREHLFEAERNLQYLRALQHFLGDLQNVDDRRTCGHHEKAFAAMQVIRESFDEVARSAYEEGQAHWQQVFQQLGAS